MADDKKVKKKKTKKTEKEPEAEPAPEPEPEPAPAPAPPESDDWLSAANEPEAAAPEPTPAPAEGEAPPPAEEGAPLAEEDMAEPPPAPKKKPRFYVHWNRRKPRFYDYNFDFGENYYSSVVNYLDSKPLGYTSEIPRRMAWAERGIVSSIQRKSKPDIKTANVLTDARTSIRNFESFQRDYVVEPGFRRSYV